MVDKTKGGWGFQPPFFYKLNKFYQMNKAEPFPLMSLWRLLLK